MSSKPRVSKKEAFIVEWPLFGELSRALALKVARAYSPDLVLGVAPLKAVAVSQSAQLPVVA